MASPRPRVRTRDGSHAEHSGAKRRGGGGGLSSCCCSCTVAAHLPRGLTGATTHGFLAGDALALCLSFRPARDLLLALPRVNRSFRDCIYSSPHAWPTSVDLDTLSLRSYGFATEAAARGGPRVVDLRRLWRLVQRAACSWYGSDAGVSALAPLYPRLRSVKTCWAKFTDTTLHALASGCPRLQSIEGGGAVVTSAGLCALAAGCHEL